MLSKSNPNIIHQLNEKRHKIHSKTGGWFPGKGVFSHGYSMLEELVGEKSYFQIMILNATGRMVDKRLADWIEAIYSCLSWPDPRIWCNQIGALAGVAKTSVVAGTSMGVMAADSRTYGIYPLVEGVDFIQGALTQYESGLSVQAIIDETIKAHKGKPHIMGYIRPIAKGDERLEAMEKVSRQLGFTEGKHLRLAYQIEKELLDRFDEGMNINGYMSAFLSDQQFSADEVYQIFCMLVMSGVTACYLDTRSQPSDHFLPLRCDDIDYQGKPKRNITR